MTCTHKRDSCGIGVIILEENLVEIGLILAEILLFTKCDLDLHLQGQLLSCFFCKLKSHHFYESLVNIGCMI